LRLVYKEVINNAFEAGISDAWSWWHMTPCEITGRLKAHAKAQREELERVDLTAWMIGSYVAQGYHQPKKYPKKPSMIEKEIKIETEEPEIMKNKLMTFATIHNTIEGAK
jgi:hypothetical protein